MPHSRQELTGDLSEDEDSLGASGWSGGNKAIRSFYSHLRRDDMHKVFLNEISSITVCVCACVGF